MNQNKKNPNRITIFLTDRELDILDHIQEEEGQNRITNVIHNCIAGYYRLQFSDKEYMRKKKPISKNAPEAKLTSEQLCERKGGTVGVHNGVDVCKIPQNADGSMMRFVPLNKPELF